MEINEITLLAIDDIKDNLITLNAIIKEIFPNSRLFVTQNGIEGIEIAIKENPDVILLDIVMPKIDGFEVCRRLKNCEQTKHIPIIFLTAVKENKKNRIQALELGAEAFLYKPLDETEIEAQIRAMVKIKKANIQKLREKDYLTVLVAKRTEELEKSQIAMMNLLEDLSTENETRKKTEIALREKEQHLNTLTDFGFTLIRTSGIDLQYNYFNKPWLKFTGRTLEKEICGGWVEGVHPDDLEHVLEVCKQALAKKSVYIIEYRLRHYSGAYRWIQENSSPIFDENENFVGYIGHCWDISEHKKTEEELLLAKLRAEESEIRYKSLHNASFGGIIIHDKGLILDCNQGLSEITGYSENELIGMDGFLLIAEKSREIVKEKISAKFEKPYEVIGLRKNGEEFPLHMEAREIPYKGKQVRTVEFRDISVLKRSEEALRESEAKFRLLFENMTAGFALHEMIYNNEEEPIDYRYLEVNPAFEKLTGLKTQNLIGHTVREILPNIEQYWIDFYAKVAKQRIPISYENYSQELDRYYDVLSFSPSVNKFAVIFSDITDRKLTENTQNFLINCGLPGSREDFFQSLSIFLAETLKMDYVCIDHLEGDHLTAETVAIYNAGLFEDNVKYTLKDTPCGMVVDHSFCCYQERVKELFPHDQVLQDLNAESYAGTVLIDSNGQMIGLIAIISAQKLKDKTRAETVLKLVASRAAGELERRQTVEDLRISEENFRKMVETFPMAIHLTVGIEQISKYINPAFTDLFGYTLDDVPSIEEWWTIAYPNEIYRKQISCEWNKRLEIAIRDNSRIEPMETIVQCKDGSKKFISWGYFSIGDQGYSCGLDLTDRKQAEDHIKSLLKEKELLLKETHHRIKNNMNTIFSLLMLKAQDQTDSSLINVLSESANRIQSMMVLYDKLYRFEAYSELNIKLFLPPLIQEIVSSYKTKNKIETRIYLDDVVLRLKILSPLGMIINELVSNSMKYAFTEKDNNIISIQATQDDKQIILIYEDNGKGFPDNYMMENSIGFGLHLIRMLVEQIEGTFEMNNNHKGVKFIFKFDV